MTDIGAHTINGDRDFESTYLSVRDAENRLYPDEIVRLLPNIHSMDPHAAEWKVRQRSVARLLRHFRRPGRALNVLEVGCGNGWLSAQLASLPASQVTGTDVNRHELRQASRVFNRSNLRFVYGSLLEPQVTEVFDRIVFAASIQYFRSLPAVIGAAFNHLSAQGEIHILDSPFYEDHEAPQAAMRSKQYYRSLRQPGMSSYYFHHPFSALRPFAPKVLFDPARPINRLLHKNDIFPWICINRP